MHRSTCVAFAVALLLSAAGPGAGAQRPARPADWPNAATVVRDFVAGNTRHSLAHYAIAACEKVNPYGDSLTTMLLAQPQTRELVSELAGMWSEPLRKCEDPRIARWFRTHAAQARDFFMAMRLLPPLLGTGRDEDLELVRTIVFDTARSSDLREHGFFLLQQGPYAERREELYLEALRGSARLPTSYRYNELYLLLRKPNAADFVERLAAEVRARHEHSDAPHIVTILATDIHVKITPALRTAVLRELDAISRMPQGGELALTAAAMIPDMLRWLREQGYR